MKLRTTHLFVIAAVLVILVAVLGVKHSRTIKDPNHYYSVHEYRMPCGALRRKTIERRGAELVKRMEVFDAAGDRVFVRERVIPADVCGQIQRGVFIPGFWSDCAE